MNNQDPAAGDDLAAILAIPLFLQRPPREKMMVNEFMYDTTAEENNQSSVEQPPTFEELIAVIRKLTTKRDELTETIRILKKQAEGMLKKL